MLPPHAAGNADLKQRFEREAQTIGGLNHPHICVLHDIGSETGADFIAMEYLEGETLADEVLTGRKAFDGKTEASLIAGIMNVDPAPLSALMPMTPRALERLVTRCLQES